VRQVIALQRSRSRPNAPEIMDAIHSAIREAVGCGTAVVGDISNTLVTVRALAESALAAVVFYELIRFNTTDAQGVVEEAQRAIAAVPATAMVRASLAAHAPYSVAPDVFRAIVRLNARRPCSVHLAESREEVEFIRSGTGPWRTLLEELGSWDSAWAAPGGTPVEFLDGCGFLDSRLIAVHGVQMTGGDLARLAERGVTLVTCPRSNAYTGAGTPPVVDFYESGVRVAIGTDSLASAPDLNVFSELRELRRLAPSVPAARLLDSATRQGARGLGFDAEFGTIEAGKSARLIAVSVPDGVEDVEEYLVSGIQPDQSRWLS
jgi:cytosine/adenosine deaminase-related metal-dependent hydrolase